MQTYDFKEFLKEIGDLSWHEIVSVANAKCDALEKSSYEIKGAVERRKLGSIELAEKIKGLLFFLQTGGKPAGLSDSDFQMLRPICVNLIGKKQLNESSLKEFD